MSSSPIVRTSRTSSSNSSDSERPHSERTALIACGAIAQPSAEISERHAWPVDVYPLPPLLHNQPQKIAGEVRELAERLRDTYGRVAVGYADCGTYGALDDVCADLGLERLAGPALLRRVRRAVPHRDVLRAAAGHLPAHRLPGPVVRAHGGAGARAGPLADAARRLLPLVHPRRLAGPAAGRRAARARPGRCRQPRPAPDRRRDRLHRPRARPGGPDPCSAAEALDHRRPPGLGLGDLVEGEDVQALDERARRRESRRDTAPGTARR